MKKVTYMKYKVSFITSHKLEPIFWDAFDLLTRPCGNIMMQDTPYYIFLKATASQYIITSYSYENIKNKECQKLEKVAGKINYHTVWMKYAVLQMKTRNKS